MLNDKYMQILIDYYLEKDSKQSYVIISDFIEKTGLTRQEATTFFRNNDDWKEQTIGVFKHKRW